MKKKLLLLSLTAILSLAIFACGKEKEPEVIEQNIEVDAEKEIEEVMKETTVEEITFEEIIEEVEEELTESTEGKGTRYTPYIKNAPDKNVYDSIESTLFSHKDIFGTDCIERFMYLKNITYLPESCITIEKDDFYFIGGLYGVGADKADFNGSLMGIEIFNDLYELRNDPMHPDNINWLDSLINYQVKAIYLSELLIKDDYEFNILGNIKLGMTAEEFYALYGEGDMIADYHGYGDRMYDLLVEIGISDKEGADPNTEVVKSIIVINKYISWFDIDAGIIR